MAPGESSSAAPSFLVIGHVTHDLVSGEVRLGGTASYAAVAAVRLGVRTAVLTSTSADFVPGSELNGADVHSLAAAQTTLFEHRWYGDRREQYVHALAGMITAADVPAALRSAPLVLFGPIAGELENGLLDAFPNAVRGATLQGWLRRIGPDGHVEPLDTTSWVSEPVLSMVHCAFLSEEDLGGDTTAAAATLDRWARQVRVLAVTRGAQGARVAVDARWFSIDAVPAHQVDGTGAGDIFATAFLIRYDETADPAEAARFATAAASFVVEARGVAGAPSRAEVNARLDAFPEVRLRPEQAG